MLRRLGATCRTISRRLETLCSLLGKLCVASESRQKRTRRGRVYEIGQLCGRVLFLAAKSVKIRYRIPPCFCWFTGSRHGCCYRDGTEKGKKPKLLNSAWERLSGGWFAPFSVIFSSMPIRFIQKLFAWVGHLHSSRNPGTVGILYAQSVHLQRSENNMKNARQVRGRGIVIGTDGAKSLNIM